MKTKNKMAVIFKVNALVLAAVTIFFLFSCDDNGTSTPNAPLVEDEIILISPVDDSLTTDTTPTLQWRSVSGAEGYEVQIARSRAGLETSALIFVNSSAMILFEPLTNRATHYWRVRGVNASGITGAWSDVSSFSIDWGFIRDISNTAVSADARATLSWSSVEGAVRYQVQIAGSEDELNSTVPKESLSTVYVTLSPLDKYPLYYWRVRAQGSDGQFGSWSPVSTITINRISGMQPNDATVITDTLTPQFSWDPFAGAVLYYIRIADSEASLEYAEDKTTMNPYYAVNDSEALSNLKTHYWQLRALDGEDNTLAWSPVSSITLHWGDMGSLSPDDAALISSTTPLAWDTVAGAVEYQVQVADTLSTFNDSLDHVYRTSHHSFPPPQTTWASGKTHYWRVRAIDKHEEFGEWSKLLQFIVE